MTKQYVEMLEHVLLNGEKRDDRTGTGTIGVFGYQNRYDLSKGFPLLTTKKMYDPEKKKGLFNLVFHELMWFLNGETNIRPLVLKGVNIWNDDAYRWYVSQELYKDVSPEPLSKEDFIECIKNDENFAKHCGDLGRIYGKQWTDFGGEVKGVPCSFGYYEEEYVLGINQIKEAIELIKNDPMSRRIIITAWNPSDNKKGVALPPCHVLFQMYVSTSGKLSGQLYQRSGDLFLGVPFNIASYSLLIHMIAHICDLEVGEFIHTFGDLHIYSNHVEQVTEQMKREPLPLPRLNIKRRSGIKEITDFRLEDFEITGYNSYSALKGAVSVGK